MEDDVDPTVDARPPKFDAPSAVTIALLLITAMPKPAPDHVRAAATKLRKDTVALQHAWGNAGLATAPRDRRKSDLRIDTAWGDLLEWLKAPDEVEWAESNKRLGWIESQKLTEDVNELAGPEFLRVVIGRNSVSPHTAAGAFW